VVDVHQVGPIAKGRHERNGEPVAGGFAQAGLTLYIVGQVRERVALRHPALVGDGFIATGKADRLERKEADLLRIIQRELDDAADLLVIYTVNDGHYRNDFNSGSM